MIETILEKNVSNTLTCGRCGLRPILQPANRGRSRCSGFSFRELSCRPSLPTNLVESSKLHISGILESLFFSIVQLCEDFLFLLNVAIKSSWQSEKVRKLWNLCLRIKGSRAATNWACGEAVLPTFGLGLTFSTKETSLTSCSGAFSTNKMQITRTKSRLMWSTCWQTKTNPFD